MIFLYGILALTHIVAQVIFGHLSYERDRKRREERAAEKFSGVYAPSVGVIVPVYNEDPMRLKETLASILRQEYLFGDLRAYVIDDGSKNIETVREVYETFEASPRFNIYESANKGKRNAQVRALREMAIDGFNPEVIVTIDSDTIIEEDGIKKIVQSFKDQRIGAVSGNVLAVNKEHNILTKLINYRYWMAFNQERAAQSLFRVLMCCSGPFSAYRGRVMRKLAQKYVHQTFLGKECTYGDDRHLTNLVLEDGWDVVFDSEASAKTYVPTTMRAYLKQQLRWNKSFYREMLWTVKSIAKHNAYLIYDLAMQLVLPFMLIVALINSAHRVIFIDHAYIFVYASMVALIGLVRVTYGILRTNDKGFYWFLLYGFLHVFVLIPNRIVALATIGDRKWGTR